jgi:hypothetical protein
MVTETDEVAAALDIAAERWPEEAGSRTRLLLRLVQVGRQHVVEEQRSAVGARLVALLQLHGSLSACYPQGYLDQLREDWPA